MMWARILCWMVAASTLLFGSASAQTEAPFGLVWGSPPDSVRAAGVELTSDKDAKWGESFAAARLPKAIADQDVTFLAFGYAGKLWRIVAASREFPNDPYGSAVRARYDELRALLSEKYGKGRSVHRLGTSIYAEPRYFVAGVRGGETAWYTDFSGLGVDIQIGVIASDSSTSRWRIIFEHVALRKDFEASQRAKEKGSL